MRKSCMRKSCLMIASVMLLLSGCGSTSDYSLNKDSAVTTESAAYDDAAGYYDYAEETYEEAAYDEGFTEEGAAWAETSDINDTSRKLIRNASMDVETDQYDKLLPAIETEVAKLGGYIENINSGSNNYYDYNSGSDDRRRYANMTVRIPKENLDTFLSMLGEQSNVISRSENVEDVTLQYVDLESHKKVLLTEQESLLELMKKAESVEDIITIESRLSQVRYEIESMESQLRTFDNKIDYSTVNVYINEVSKYTPTQEISRWEKIGIDFMDNLEGAVNSLLDFVIWFIVRLPYIVIWGIVIYIIYRLYKRRKAKRADGKENQTEHKRRTGRSNFFAQRKVIKEEITKENAKANEKAYTEMNEETNETDGKQENDK